MLLTPEKHKPDLSSKIRRNLGSEADQKQGLFLYKGYNSGPRQSVPEAKSMNLSTSLGNEKNENNFYRNCNNTYYIQKHAHPSKHAAFMTSATPPHPTKLTSLMLKVQNKQQKQLLQQMPSTGNSSSGGGFGFLKHFPGGAGFMAKNNTMHSSAVGSHILDISPNRKLVDMTKGIKRKKK